MPQDSKTTRLDDLQETQELSRDSGNEQNHSDQVVDASADTSKPHRPRKKTIGMVVIAVVAALLICGCCLALGSLWSDWVNPTPQVTIIDSTSDDESGSTDNESTEDTSDDEATSEEEYELGEEDTHNWTTNWEIQTIPAQTHTERHDAVYEDQTTYHTVCNICKTVCDSSSAVATHKAETGHNSGYSANVPITNSVLVSPAWDETVVDVAESQELVANGEICTDCGQTRGVSE